MFTEEFVLIIIAYGASVIGIVEIIKRFLPKLVDGWVAVIFTVAISFGVCFTSFNIYTWYQWLFIVFLVILESNGLFRAFHTKR